jgi:hypothetical protein
MLPEEPAHHRRYRVAWLAYKDPDTPADCKLDLEKEMDDAKNHFESDEFHTFKKTLDGFVEHWDGLETIETAIKKKFPDANWMD